MNTDMAMTMNGTDGGDMAMPAGDMHLKQGSAGMIGVDIVGTAYGEDPDGGEVPAPATHILVTKPSFPQWAYPADYDNSNPSPPPLSGCTVNRYDNTGTAHPTPPDVDTGTVTLTGYNTKLMAAAVTAPSTANPYGLGGPAPATVTCVNPGGTLPFYNCFFGTPTGTTTPIDGKLTNSLAFPAIGQVGVTTSAAAAKVFYGNVCAAIGAGCTAADCLDSDVVTADGVTYYCMQHLWPYATAANQAIMHNPGMNGYAAFDSTIGTGGSCTPTGCLAGNKQFPDAVTITSITVGGTEITHNHHPLGFPTLDDLHGNLDPTKDIVITWACAPPTGTTLPAAGTNCTTNTGITNYVTFSAVTSQTARDNFAAGFGAQYGSMTCFEQTNKTSASMTISKDAVKAFLGTPAQSTGSAWVILMNIEGAGLLVAPKQLQAAGAGSFAFINFP